MDLAITCENERLSRPQLMKVLIAIDRQLVREASQNNVGFKGLAGSELISLDKTLTEFLKLDLTDADVDLIAQGNLEGLGLLKKLRKGIKNVAKKVGNAVSNVASKVADTAKTVVQKAAQAVKWVATLPLRGLVDIALKTMKGPVAKAFVYAFIPENSEVLKKNPEVARKRKVQLETIQKIRKALAFETSHLNKHIRNAIVSHYKKNPEEVIHDLSTKKDNEVDTLEFKEGLEGLTGEPVSGGTLAAAAGLITAIGGIIVVFKKNNYPKGSDFTQPIPANQNVTNDPAYTSDDPVEQVVEFVKSPIGIGVSLLLASGIGYGIYTVATN